MPRSDYGEVTRASTERRQTISKKEQVEAHEAAFGDLLRQVSKSTELPGDEVVYKDYMGFTTGGEPVDLVSKMFEAGWSKAFAEFNRHVRKGMSVYDATREVAKAADTTQFSLPVFVAPDVQITDEQDLPFADMVARVAIQEDTYKTDELTDHGAAERFYEPGTNSGTKETWVSNDDTYATNSYNVLPYGRQTAVTDFLQLASSALRNQRSITEESLVFSIREYEENQAMQGTGSVTGISGNDANGWSGLPDLADSGNVTDESSASISESKVRTDIKTIRRNGGSYDNIVGFTDHTTFDDLADDVDDWVRYVSPGDELNFGFRALNIRGVPIMETHGCPDSSSSRQFILADMSRVTMAMLQDVTLHPLARTDPQEDIAVDAYGVLANNASNRITVRHSLN